MNDPDFNPHSINLAHTPKKISDLYCKTIERRYDMEENKCSSYFSESEDDEEFSNNAGHVKWITKGKIEIRFSEGNSEPADNNNFSNIWWKEVDKKFKNDEDENYNNKLMKKSTKDCFIDEEEK